MKKRIVSILLVLSLWLTLLPAQALAADTSGQAPAIKFTDVADNSYYSAAVQWAVENQITTGTSATKFSPDQKCTRAQIITFLWRAVGSPEPEGLSTFPDVKPDMYYTKAVAWAQENGIVFGTEFNPDKDCHRQSAVEFLWRNAGRPKAREASFEDADWESVDWAVEQGITNGTSATNFSPWNTCTRAQIITLLYRALAQDVEWNFLFVILPNTDISYTNGAGEKIVDKHTMTDREIELIKRNAQLFANEMYDMSEHIVYPRVTTVVVDTPVTFNDLAPYGTDQYWLSESKARRFLPSSVNLNDYDHVTVFADIGSETVGDANYWGLGGTDFGQSTGYSFIRHHSTEYALWVFDEERRWPPAVIVHELLHFVERWSAKRGCPLTITVHDGEALGYENDNQYWDQKVFYNDFIRHAVPQDDGTTAGVPAATWRQPPRLFR